MFKKIYLGFGGLVASAYLLSALAGWELKSAVQDRLDDNARKSTGGYRSHTYWHSYYYRGGK